METVRVSTRRTAVNNLFVPFLIINALFKSIVLTAGQKTPYAKSLATNCGP
jgi:hypothetical protein